MLPMMLSYYAAHAIIASCRFSPPHAITPLPFFFAAAMLSPLRHCYCRHVDAAADDIDAFRLSLLMLLRMVYHASHIAQHYAATATRAAITPLILLLHC